ncbi:hypothetical protein OEZ85_010318 [Tetradesmus obliquus]|uniref:Metallo-beta-lactamase domain-containing protein n=1 Tax=Tetradesmus obliquus TaxID=3088 RepID=A0ABY8TQQ4_TETOB|nr:hypothetical protein OEZ85_010318 [Tetradesmus obliquus]
MLPRSFLLPSSKPGTAGFGPHAVPCAQPHALFMVDCGEGSHRQARSTGLQLEQVDSIFITHLHGDHCFGIGSMLVSLCAARRAQREREQQQQQQQQQQQRDWPAGEGPGVLRLVGPPKLGELVSALLVGAGVGRRLDLPVYVTEFCEDDSDAHGWQPLPGCAPGQAFVRRLAPQVLPREQLPAGLLERLDRAGLDWQNHPSNTRRTMFKAKSGLVWRLASQHATITAAQLQHRVPCWGYVFDELTPQQQQQQQQQEHEQDEKDEQQQQQQRQGRRVLILGDTVDSRAIAPVACGADLVSHEATFASGMEGKAAVAQHSTAWMAGEFAAAIQARSLVLTHFSARYEGSAPGSSGGPPQQGGRGGRGGQQDRRVRAWEVAQANEEAAAADERAVKALQREAEECYNGGPILLAADLFTAHVPARQPQGDGK